MQSRIKITHVLCAGVAAFAMVPGMAYAQEGPAETDAKDGPIVVTGTLVRGVAPAGANPIAVNSEAIAATGATSVAQVLQTIPQLGSFGDLQQPLANSPEVSVNRPNLRDLPGNNTAGGSTTLVMMDGHRMVGMGNSSTGPDPDVIPPGVIERIEIVPDGGSALYGSDAVAGVMNFVTIKRFDGLKIDGSYGIADDYYRYDINVTGGRDWGSGSAFISYNYAKSDELLGKDRGYIREFPASNGLLSLTCSPGNIQALAGALGRPAGTVVGLPGGRTTPPNQCDMSDYATVFPASKRHSVFAGLTQELNDSLTFEIRGFYTNRQTDIQNGPFVFTQRIGLRAIPGIAITSPFTGAPGGPNALDAVQQVTGQFGPNDGRKTTVELDTWGITPTITADLDGNFQLRVLGNYGESVANFRGASVNEAALQNAITAGLFNPYAPATATSEVTDAITNFQEYNRTRQYFQNARAIIDGDIFQLPAGAAKIAFGLEYFHEQFRSENGQAVPGFANSGFAGQSIGGRLIVPAVAPVSRFNVARNVKSAFGELVVPVLGGGDGVELTVSAAARYDDYSDVGDTFNPRFGATFNPVDWISIKGAWGTSFNAPSLADNEDAAISTAYILSGQQASFFAPPASLVTPNGPYPRYTGQLIMALRGNAPDIKPQEATTWTLGFDMQPPIIPGLSFGVSYYNIKFDKLIGLAPFQDPAQLYRDFGNLITIAPSQALLDAAIASADVINGGIVAPPASQVYAFFDARKTNLGDVKVDGLDFRLNYALPTSFGEVFLNSNGTYELNRKQSSTPGAAFIDTGSNNTSQFKVRTTAGAEVGSFQGQITWNHIGGYDLDPIVGYVPQDHVSSFNTFDMYLRYEVGGTGIGEDLAFTFNVENMFDQDPPEYRGGSQVGGTQGIANGNTIGRLFQIGVSKKF